MKFQILQSRHQSRYGDSSTALSLMAYQFADVANALAGARIRRGTISAGYSQVIPSQPIAKNLRTVDWGRPARFSELSLNSRIRQTHVLKTKSITAAAIPRPLFSGTEVKPANRAIEADMPIAPNSMRDLLPNLSMVKMAIHEAMKYSVPLQAARSRERLLSSPILNACSLHSATTYRVYGK